MNSDKENTHHDDNREILQIITKPFIDANYKEGIMLNHKSLALKYT